MAGVQATSYLRGINATSFARQQNWKSPDDVPDDVIEEFRRPDGRTSLWDEGYDASRRELLALALASQRRQIRTLRAVPIFSDCLPGALVARLSHTTGDTPLGEARRYHYELGDARREDYARLALAADTRFAPFNYDTKSVADMLEDAIIAGRISLAELHADLQSEVATLLRNRRITADDLRKSLDSHIIVDIRAVESDDRIPGAQWVDPSILADAPTALPHGIAKRKPIVLYCSDGTISLCTARRLRRNGYKLVRILIGGYTSWQTN